MSGRLSDTTQSVTAVAQVKEAGDGPHRIGDFWQWFGTSGDPFGTDGTLHQTFLISYAVAAVIVAVVNTLSVITWFHEQPQLGLAPVVWEGTSWLSFIAFYWIPWLAWRIAPITIPPKWWLLIHAPLGLAFGLAHVTGFILLRKLIYWLAGGVYDFGSFLSHFPYEFSKDGLGYVVTIVSFSTIEYLLQQHSLSVTPGQTFTFDIRDGAKLTRVRLSDVLAIASAGNYVEFVLNDGRRLLMRSPLSALETELSPRGFLRTHRSWLVNAAQMTALTPEGSGDYEVELGPLKVPLSRRFPQALEKLRGS